MLNLDLRTLFPQPLKPEMDIPAALFMGQLWTYALTVLNPARALKSLGLYPKNEIGEYPEIMSAKGEGQYYCKQYRTPSYLDEKPAGYNRVEDFDRTAALYETCMWPISGPMFQETVTLMRQLLVPHARIMDLSCGPGTETLKLTDLVPAGEVVGVDLSAGMVAQAFHQAQRRGVENTAFFQADVACLPEHFEGRFDAVHCSFAFHHYPDPAAALREIYRVLNESGKAFIIDPGTGWFNCSLAPMAKWGDAGWVGFYTGEGFRSLFREAGFSKFYWTEVLPGIGVSIGTK